MAVLTSVSCSNNLHSTFCEEIHWPRYTHVKHCGAQIFTFIQPLTGFTILLLSPCTFFYWFCSSFSLCQSRLTTLSFTCIILFLVQWSGASSNFSPLTQPCLKHLIEYWKTPFLFLQRSPVHESGVTSRKQGSANVFCKGPDSQSLMLLGPKVTLKMLYKYVCNKSKNKFP